MWKTKRAHSNDSMVNTFSKYCGYLNKDSVLKIMRMISDKREVLIILGK